MRPREEARREARALSGGAASSRSDTLCLVRRLLLLALLLVCCAPAAAWAQEEPADGVETETTGDEDYEPDQRGADPQPEPDPQYEPDQRGVDGGSGGGEEGYEPDQRGEHESPEPDREVQLTSAGMEAAEYAPGGRLFGVHASLWLGGGYTGLDAFGARDLVRDGQRGGAGFNLGFSVGPRIGPVNVGLRHTLTVDGGFTMGTLGVDAQVALPALGPVIPTVRLGLGYAFFFGLSDPLPAQSEARLDGIYAELGIGAALRLGGPFMVGAELSGGWTHLWRQPVEGCATGCSDGGFDARRPGEGDGLTLRLQIWGGVSF